MNGSCWSGILTSHRRVRAPRQSCSRDPYLSSARTVRTRISKRRSRIGQRIVPGEERPDLELSSGPSSDERKAICGGLGGGLFPSMIGFLDAWMGIATLVEFCSLLNVGDWGSRPHRTVSGGGGHGREGK